MRKGMWFGRHREEREQTQMTHRILLTALLLLLSGCQQSPQQARRELAELGVEFTAPVFHASAENGDLVVVQLFLTAGMNPDITDEDDDVTPLVRAIFKNNVSVARALLDSGAKPDFEDNGTTLLDWAAEQGQTEMVRLLLEAGAEKEISDRALSNARRKGYAEIVELFESAPVSVEEANESSAISSIRNIVTSQITYSATVGKGSYAVNLGTIESVNQIESVLGSGIKDGYAFNTRGGANTFTINATPLDYGSTGSRSFFSNETGVIRYTRENRPATVADLPLGQ